MTEELSFPDVKLELQRLKALVEKRGDAPTFALVIHEEFPPPKRLWADIKGEENLDKEVTCGWASERTIDLWLGSDKGDARGVLLHEIAHIKTPLQRHNRVFHFTLFDLLAKYLDLDHMAGYLIREYYYHKRAPKYYYLWWSANAKTRVFIPMPRFDLLGVTGDDEF